jgi:hypothetical protein
MHDGLSFGEETGGRPQTGSGGKRKSMLISALQSTQETHRRPTQEATLGADPRRLLTGSENQLRLRPPSETR